MALELESPRETDRSSGCDPALRLALAGGGTGGHLLPGRHLLSHLLDRGEPRLADLLWFTSGRSVEEQALAGLEEELGPVPQERAVLAIEPPGGGAPSRPRLALRTPGATWSARAALRRRRSQVLLGLGGFTSLPAVLAARSLGLPVVLLEVNAVPGAATRLLAPLAARVLHAFPSGFDAARTRRLHVGPLLSPELVRTATEGRRLDERGRRERSQRARRALGFDPRRPLLVVLGGSQGAGSLNAFVRAHAPELLARGVQVLHQSGPGRAAEGCGERAGYRCQEFTREVPRWLAAATLVLCRAGASTLLEVAAAAVPAVVVPYPHAAKNHQERNALELGRGVRRVADRELDGERARELLALLGSARAAEREALRAALVDAVPLDGAQRVLAVLAELGRARTR